MKSRSYTLQKRARTIEATRSRILQAASELFMARWYDEVSLKEIAEAADVSLSTLVRHFASKGELVQVLSQTPGVNQWTRDDARVGDVDDAVRALLDDYEATGDAVIRALALEEKLPELRAALDKGRASHRAWIERVFAPLLPSTLSKRAPIVDDLVVVLDVYAWKLWRRDMTRSKEETFARMTGLVRMRLLASSSGSSRVRAESES